ncbi:polysaccharide biosynthesis protein [Andreprevotia chitinilytica]|uniref:polysaccharide biosynthesis protein n=1 Tax=Andreprevotia chitinilytica TaxID=396808 RepID=UPI00068DA636|nr:nucleoside-diphosphate sugar epimerase/dehydratase [Andreprevotia chitinilytica]
MIKQLANLPRRTKSLLILTVDFFLLPLALWISIALRLDNWRFQSVHAWWVYFLPSLIAIPIFVRMGLYRSVIRCLEDRGLATIVIAVTIAVGLFAGLVSLLSLPVVPRGALLIFWILAIVCISASRFVVRAVLRGLLQPGGRARCKVLIYGAGSAGRQLVVALRTGQEYVPVAFVDDDPRQQGLLVAGVKVFAPMELSSLVRALNVRQVLLAIPSASRNRRVEIINQLEPLHVEVREVPGITDLVEGEVRLADVREVGVDELLGREIVPPNIRLLSANIIGKCVMVTGAGGSIGSELCRQIFRNQPVRLVLYEHSEFALYSIEHELRQFASAKRLSIDIIPVLGSVQNGARLFGIMVRYGVQTVYHAAAYKHVPIVEFNMTEGLLNNVFGTRATADAAIRAKVDTFVLISTDKAVRPTNVMGASKRMAELVLQAYAQDPAVKTVFSMVRFGNVLGSSGSVVPLFRKQISAGGPVTVTHPDIIRYFMTIPEAAQLVIQAGAMGNKGEVFVLDMGQPVKIVDLARRMIHLSGFSVKDEINPDGDIAIQFSGLRPGEKLYEELLIGDDVSGTDHPRIMKANERCISKEELDIEVVRLAQACALNEFGEIHEILSKCVAGFCPDENIRDHLHEVLQHGTILLH